MNEDAERYVTPQLYVDQLLQRIIVLEQQLATQDNLYNSMMDQCAQHIREKKQITKDKAAMRQAFLAEIAVLNHDLATVTKERDEWKRKYEETVQWQMQSYQKNAPPEAK